jgi:hypothetical protein
VTATGSLPYHRDSLVTTTASLPSYTPNPFPVEFNKETLKDVNMSMNPGSHCSTGGAAPGHEPSRAYPIALASQPTMQESSRERESKGRNFFRSTTSSQQGTQAKLWSANAQSSQPRSRALEPQHVSLYRREWRQLVAAEDDSTSRRSQPSSSRQDDDQVFYNRIDMARASKDGQLHFPKQQHSRQVAFTTETSPSSPGALPFSSSKSSSYVQPPRTSPRTSSESTSSTSYHSDKSHALPSFSLYLPPSEDLGRQVHLDEPVNLDSECTPNSFFTRHMRSSFSNLGGLKHIEEQTANSLNHPLCQQGNLTLFARGTSGRDVEIKFPGSLVSDNSASNLVCLRSLLILGWTVDWRKDQALLHTPDKTDTLILHFLNGMYVFPPLFSRSRHIEAGVANTRTSATQTSAPSMARAAPSSQQASPAPPPTQGGSSLRPRIVSVTSFAMSAPSCAAPSSANAAPLLQQATPALTPSGGSSLRPCIVSVSSLAMSVPSGTAPSSANAAPLLQQATPAPTPPGSSSLRPRIVSVSSLAMSAPSGAAPSSANAAPLLQQATPAPTPPGGSSLRPRIVSVSSLAMSAPSGAAPSSANAAPLLQQATPAPTPPGGSSRVPAAQLLQQAPPAPTLTSCADPFLPYSGNELASWHSLCVSKGNSPKAPAPTRSTPRSLLVQLPTPPEEVAHMLV